MQQRWLSGRGAIMAMGASARLPLLYNVAEASENQYSYPWRKTACWQCSGRILNHCPFQFGKTASA